MRITAFWAILLSILCFSPHARGQSTKDSESKQVISGEIVYSGLDALPWHTKVHVYIKDKPSTLKGLSDLVAEQNVLTEGEQIPIKFSLNVPDRVARSNSTYAICADISIMDRLSFVCDKPIYFRGSNQPKRVRLTLRRVM